MFSNIKIQINKQILYQLPRVQQKRRVIHKNTKIRDRGAAGAETLTLISEHALAITRNWDRRAAENNN